MSTQPEELDPNEGPGVEPNEDADMSNVTVIEWGGTEAV